MARAKEKPAPDSPATYVGPGILAADDLVRHEILAGLKANNDLAFRFSEAYYRSPYTFNVTRVLGHLACKIPTDLWTFHDLFCQYRFRTVIETGTAGGGTTLWFATLMDLLQVEGGLVVSIDPEPQPDLPQHPRIRYAKLSSLEPAAVHLAKSACERGGPVLVDLDSDHRAGHVLAELERYAPLCKVGDWLVVEDTNGAPVVRDPHTGKAGMIEGPFTGLMEYLNRHPGEFLRDVVCERHMLTMNPYGWLQRQQKCTHD